MMNIYGTFLVFDDADDNNGHDDDNDDDVVDDNNIVDADDDVYCAHHHIVNGVCGARCMESKYDRVIRSCLVSCFCGRFEQISSISVRTAPVKQLR